MSSLLYVKLAPSQAVRPGWARRLIYDYKGLLLFIVTTTQDLEKFQLQYPKVLQLAQSGFQKESL